MEDSGTWGEWGWRRRRVRWAAGGSSPAWRRWARALCHRRRHLCRWRPARPRSARARPSSGWAAPRAPRSRARPSRTRTKSAPSRPINIHERWFQLWLWLWLERQTQATTSLQGRANWSSTSTRRSAVPNRTPKHRGPARSVSEGISCWSTEPVLESARRGLRTTLVCKQNTNYTV